MPPSLVSLFKSTVDLVGCHHVCTGAGAGGRVGNSPVGVVRIVVSITEISTSSATPRFPKTGRLGECWNAQFVSFRQSGTFHSRKLGIPLALRREHDHRSSQNRIVIRRALPHHYCIGSAAGGWLVVRAIVLLSVQDDKR